MEQIPHFSKKEQVTTVEVESEIPPTESELMLQQYKLDQDKSRVTYNESIPHLEQVLDSVDWNTMADIYKEYLQKSGVDSLNMNWVKRDDIYFVTDSISKSSLMTYLSPPINAILINSAVFDEQMRDSPHSVSVKLLHGLMHEYAHATGHLEKRVEINLQGDISVAQDVFGLAIHHRFHINDGISDSVYASTYLLLNEAITERISHEVLVEYIARVSAKNKNELARTGKFIEDSMLTEKGNYAAARHMIMALTSAMAEEAGVPEHVVWRGFVKQYYSGELETEEMRDLLNETFGGGFGRQLMDVQSEDDIQKLVGAFNKISAQYPETADKWFQHLHVTRGAK